MQPDPRIVPHVTTRRRRLFNSLFGWWIARREREAENRRLFYRLGSTIMMLETSIKQFKLVADQMMRAQARAEVRLAQLSKNHEVLREVLNAQGEAVEALQKSANAATVEVLKQNAGKITQILEGS